MKQICWALLLVGLTATSAFADEPVFEISRKHTDKGERAQAMQALLASITAQPRDARVPFLVSDLLALDLTRAQRAQVAKTLEAILAKLGDHWNRDRLVSALASLKVRLGQLEQAVALFAKRGALDAWLVTGPLGLTRNASLHKVLGPEIAASQQLVDAKRTFPAWRGAKRRWHVLKRDPRSMSLRLGRVLKGSGAVSYAMTHVKVAKEQQGYLVFRGPSAKVWLNRTLVSVVDRSQERLPTRLRIPVTLRAGWNRLLLKLAGSTFSLRLVSRQGGPLEATSTSTPQSVAVGKGEVEPPYPAWYMQELSVDQKPGRRALYAHGLIRAGLVEEGYTVLEDLSRSRPELKKQAWFHFLRGEAARNAGHLPWALQRDRSRAAYRRALELDPKYVAPRQRLASILLADDKTVQGILALEKILEEYPRHLEVRLSLFNVLMGKGWRHAASDTLRAAEKHGGRGVSAVLMARARLLANAGKDAAAQRVRENLLQQDSSQTWVILRRMNRALARGDGQAALVALTAYGKQAGQTDDELAPRRIQIHRAMGHRAKERKALEAWLAKRPHQRARKLQVARRLAQDAAADPKALTQAVSLLSAVLSERPEEHTARALRDALQKKEDRFWEEWKPNLKKVLGESPKRSHWPRASTVCLFDQTVTKIYKDTSTVDVIHQVWRILNEAGKRRYGSRPRSGQVLQIRTITPSGETLEPIVTSGRSYQMPGLAAGAVVEHSWKTSSRSSRFQYSNGPFFFQDPDLSEPFWFSRWVLMIHKDAPVTIIERNMKRKGITKKVELRGVWKVYTFTARNQPRIEREPFSPGRREMLPWIKVIEKRTLDEIGDLYLERALRGRALTPVVTRKAQQVVFGVKGDAARARKLYDFVQHHVRRRSRESRPARILASRAGDKTWLFLALLRAAAVPHQLVLAGPSPHAAVPVDWSNPEPGQFSLGRRLVRIAPRGGQAFYVYADGHRLTPYAKLPYSLWGASAYICDPSGGRLDVLPTDGLTAEASVSELGITLRDGGGAKARYKQVIGSYGAYEVKERIQQARMFQLRSFFARRANAFFPGSRLLDFDTPDLDVPGKPLTWSYELDAPRAVRPRGDGTLALRGFLPPSRVGRRYAAYRHRVYDLILSQPEARRDTVRVDLGPYACPLLPKNVRLNTSRGQFSLVFAREGAERVRIERRLVLRPGRVKPKDYKAFREFLRQIDEAERAFLTLEARK